MKHIYLAVDLGATSGRTVVGELENGMLSQRELTRFANPIIQVAGHYFWDIFALYGELIKALKQCAEQHIEIESIGIDTWGVDVVCFDAHGLPLRNPYSYRDPHTTQSVTDGLFAKVPKWQVYETTGIQFMNINTLFQLEAMLEAQDGVLQMADKILFIPDALTYMLTGTAVCESTILSTSQLLNPRTKQIDETLLNAVRVQQRQMGRRVEPGTIVGTLSDEVRQLTGLGAIPVVAVAGHDTASAVAAVPARDESYAYLSCGTWSLLGIELQAPIINQQSYDLNFTNEGGVFGTTRFLKNICGLWIFERCRAEWQDAPQQVAQLVSAAAAAPSCGTKIDPDDPMFANPVSMVSAINDYCAQHHLVAPQGYAQTARCIFESLAAKYKEVVDMLRMFAPFEIRQLHVIGGGSQNAFLMQLAADELQMPVVTGPVEGTAMGNLMMQAVAAGVCGNLKEMREVVGRSTQVHTYMPQR
ncbi:MAG: rhamnulokinase [Bacteroidales bacterium]|nr:rhamnulokinase [Candidatus Colimorpha onthohippi]